MKLRLLTSTFFLCLWLWNSLAFAGVEQISEKEFRDLAQELSGKVTLFKDAWKEDPKSEFYGGTTRDYLYWLKGQFLNAHNRAQAETTMHELRESKVIDVRQFIVGDSDVDIISRKGGGLNEKDHGVRKIDYQPNDILNPATELGKNEIHQGYLPAEKIRLGREGFPPGALGDGIHEIYTGRITAHFAEAAEFAATKYAKEGLNHPILLALRYLRLASVNYYRTNGPGWVNEEKLIASLDPDSAKAVRGIISQATRSGELTPYFEEHKFKSWFNGSIQKSFSSFTSPDAARMLMQNFGIDTLAAAYPDYVDPINQYVFAQKYDPERVEAFLRGAKTKAKDLYQPLKKYFPDGLVYHGTGSEQGYRGILLQGALPSTSGAAGNGLYVVGKKDLKFAIGVGHGKERVVQFRVDPKTHLVDITKGEGERVWEATRGVHGSDYEKFAEIVGADMIRYPYDPADAFIVKNSTVLSKAEGLVRKIAPLGELLKQAPKVQSVESMLKLFDDNALSRNERTMFWEASSLTGAQAAEYLRHSGQTTNTELVLLHPHWSTKPEVQAVLREWLGAPMDTELGKFAAYVTGKNKTPDANWIKMAEGFYESHRQNKELESALFDYLKEVDAPHFTDYAMDKIRAGRALIPPKNAQIAIMYLGNKPTPSPEILDELYEDYKFWKINETERSFYAKILARSPEYREEILRDAINLVTATLPEKLPGQVMTSISVKNEYLTLLHDCCKGDPRVPQAIARSLEIDFAKHVDPMGPGSIYSFRNLIPENTEAKTFLLGKLKNPETRYASVADMLSETPLTDHELAQLIDSLEVRIRQRYLGQALERNQYLGPESVRALFRAYLRAEEGAPANEGEGELRPIILDALSRYRDKSTLQNYALEVLKEKNPVSALPPVQVNKLKELERMSELVHAGVVPANPEWTNAAFTLLENSNKPWGYREAVVQFVKAAPVEDPAVQARAEKLLIRAGAYFELLKDYAGRVKQFTPELQAYLLKMAEEDGDKIPKPLLERFSPESCELAYKKLL